MKTRRQRNGGTRRGGGVTGIAKAVVGNLSNGGGRLTQWNQIINGFSPEAWRMYKGMTVLMAGEKLDDPKYKSLNVVPSADYLGKISVTPAPLASAVKGAPVSETVEVVPETESQEIVSKSGGTRKNKRNRI